MSVDPILVDAVCGCREDTSKKEAGNLKIVRFLIQEEGVET